MKFGKTDRPDLVDFTIPPDHPDTLKQLEINGNQEEPLIYVGCAKWNRQDLQNFYPPGTRDELTYYSTQFNCIELNATFYRIFPSTVFAGWREKTPDDFVFFPKLYQAISHRKRLRGTEEYVNEFLANASYLENKLGMVFLQMIENFSPRNRDSLIAFVQNWPREVPLAVELRHTDWFNDPVIAEELYRLFEEYGITNIIVDTALRRDLMHMRLTTPYAFIRYVGANHSSDTTRLDDWVTRLLTWSEMGIRRIAFFVHQNHELESPLLARYLIEQINKRMGYQLAVPATLPAEQKTLF